MPPTKAEIEELYFNQMMTVEAVAKHFKVSHAGARRWFTKYQIPVRPHNNTTDKWDARKEEITFLYHQCRLSQERIAQYYGTGQNQICTVMKRLGIPRHSKGRRGAEHHQYKDGKSSVLYRKLIVKNQCSHCGSTDKLGIHHKNNDHYDNRIENLEVLCNSCHMSETKKAWWAAKKAGKTYKGNARVGWKPKHVKSPR